jgi:hypothetical protein
LRHYGAVARRGLLRATVEKDIRSASKGKELRKLFPALPGFHEEL